ncbi:MAG TPA: hypothetical protein VG944_10345 [Fimbriimonas sp.]|nr:hypothetical protein [Fimbriimonas sp.]
MRKPVSLILASTLVVAGCGGGQSSNLGGGQQGGDHSQSVGIASISYRGDFVPAAVFSNSGVTVTSMAGASFTNVQLNPAPKKENSMIVFVRGWQIWTWQNGTLNQITRDFRGYSDPAMSKNGLIVFSGYEVGMPNVELYTCNADGSNLKQITNTSVSHGVPTFSPSGTKIAFYGSGKIFTVNTDGTGEAEVVPTGSGFAVGTSRYPNWSPDGTKIIFDAKDATDSTISMFSMPSTGGPVTKLSNFSEDHSFPCWTPNGNSILVQLGESNDIIAAFDATNPNAFTTVASGPSGTDLGHVSCSPDGNSIVFASTSSSTYGIDTQLLGSTSSLTSIVSDPVTGSVPLMPRWSPFFGPKTFVGPGGQMSTAGGFIWGQAGDGFGGFASLSATTPTTMTITQQTAGTAGGPVTYLAKADKITKIVYSNSYFGAYTAVTPSNSKQVLISVSTLTGQIDTVAPLAQPGLTSSTRGGLAYDGRFAAIYDSHGNNLAPLGAKHIELDSVSGGVKQWR